MNPSRLRALLIGVLLSTQLVTAGIVALALQRDTAAARRITIASTFERFAERVDERARPHLERAEEVIGTGGRLVAAGLLDGGDDTALARYFSTELGSHAWISAMRLGRADGSSVHVTRTPNGPRTRIVAHSDPDRLDDAPLDAGIDGSGSLRGVPDGSTLSDATVHVESPSIDGEVTFAVARPFQTMSHSWLADVPGTERQWSLIARMPFERYAASIDAPFARRLAVLGAALALCALAAVVAVLRVTRPVYGIHRDATTDRLTGACNRAEFERRVGARLANRRHDGGSAVLVAFDLDGFKGVNDRFGHAAGDAVLIDFVQRLRRCLRASDIVGRLGGDEFVLALDVDPAADELALVERLRERVVGKPLRFGAEPLVVGATTGVARRLPGESVTATLARADRALVCGKAIAKNRSYAASREAYPSAAAPRAARTLTQRGSRARSASAGPASGADARSVRDRSRAPISR